MVQKKIEMVHFKIIFGNIEIFYGTGKNFFWFTKI